MSRPPLELFLYSWELLSMPDYSSTLPSGTTIGKVWRRSPSGGGSPCDSLALEMFDAGSYVVGMYVPDFEGRPDSVGIVWLRVVPRSGPMPPCYHAPDWANYQQWKKDRAREREERAA